MSLGFNMQRLSVGANLPQIIVPEDGIQAGRKISTSEDGWQCQGQSLKLCQRVEGDTIQVRKLSTSYAASLAPPPPQRRRRSSTNSRTGSQGSYSLSEQNNSSSDDGRKIQSDISVGITKTNDGKTTRVDKLPNIITGAEKRKISTTRKNERKRKKSQVKNAANRSRQKQSVELKKEMEDEVKYGLDLTRSCRPGLDITRPYIFSYFPKIVDENEKQIKNGGKDSTTSKTIAMKKFVAS